MINKFKTNLYMDDLTEETNKLTYKKDDTGVWMANCQSGGIPFKTTKIQEAVSEISRITGLPALHIMVNKIDPQIVVGKHQDWLAPTKSQGKYPTLPRYHLPIQTNDKAWWWDEENHWIQMKQGHWYGPMSYWKMHSVRNLGDTPRIHLIVDLDCSVRLGNYAS